MVGAFEGADVVAVEDDFAFEFVPVLLDVVVLHHHYHEVDVIEEGVEVVILVCHDVAGDEGVVAFEGTCEVALLSLKELEGGRLAAVIDVFFVGESVETYAAVVGDAFLLHYLVDAVEHECGLRVVGLHRLVYHLGEAGVVAHEKPWVDGDAMSAHTRSGLQDVDARVHVANLDDFIYVHIVVATDAAQLVGKGDVDGAEGVFHHFGHLCGAYVGHHDFALAK